MIPPAVTPLHGEGTKHVDEYMEQQAIERIALTRFPEATGVKEIQPFVMTDKPADAWFVIMTTADAFRFLTTLVTGEDLRGVSKPRDDTNSND